MSQTNDLSSPLITSNDGLSIRNGRKRLLNSQDQSDGSNPPKANKIVAENVSKMPTRMTTRNQKNLDRSGK